MHNSKIVTEPVEPGVVIKKNQISFYGLEHSLKSIDIKLNFLRVKINANSYLEPIATLKLDSHTGPVRSFELVLVGTEFGNQFVPVDAVPQDLSLTFKDVEVVSSASGVSGIDRLLGERFAEYLSTFQQLQAEIVYDSGYVLTRLRFIFDNNKVFGWDFLVEGWDSRTDTQLKPCMLSA